MAYSTLSRLSSPDSRILGLATCNYTVHGCTQMALPDSRLPYNAFGPAILQEAAPWPCQQGCPTGQAR
eukprot:13073656-Heterocapsa_arctica.AAC.1